MKAQFRFLGRTLLFMLISLVMLFSLYWLTRPLSGKSVYGHTASRYQLLRELPGRRLILVGGSSMSYGVDSPALQSYSGLFPVNLALTSRMGITFMLEEVTAFARAGDIIVLSPEYHHFCRGCFEPFHCLRAVIANPECIPFSRELLVEEELPASLLRIPAVFQRYIREDLFPETPETDALNMHGDIIDEYQDNPDGRDFSRISTLTVSEDCIMDSVITQLNRFADVCREENVTLLFIYPPYSQRAFDDSEEFILFLDSTLRRDLEIPILNRPEDSCYPDSLFYNTDYHLNVEGSQLRTGQLWEAISPYI